MNVRTLVACEADKANLPRLLGFLDGLHRSAFGKNAVRVGIANHFVKLEEIDPVGLKAAQGLVDLACSGGLIASIDLGHEKSFLAITSAQRVAHADFTLAAVIVPAVIEKMDSVIDCGTDDPNTLRLLEFRFAKMKSAEPHHGNLFSRAAERPAGDFSLGSWRRRVRREARKDGGPSGSFQELPASNRGAVLALGFLFILGPDCYFITAIAFAIVLHVWVLHTAFRHVQSSSIPQSPNYFFRPIDRICFTKARI